MRTSRMIALTAVLAWLAVGELRADPSAEPPADVTCRLDGGAGVFHVNSGPAGTDIRVTGAAGGYTGTATITFGAGMATPKMKFRFAGLRTLDTFTLTSGRHSFQGQLGWGVQRSAAYFDKNGRRVSGPALAAVTLLLEATKAGDVEITVTTSRDVEWGKDVRINWMLQLRGRKGNGGLIKPVD
jgi:hypothetical protein